MFHIKHVGIYVDDIYKEKLFYEKCFELKCIVDQEDASDMLDELLQKKSVKIHTVKLITAYGVSTKIGEMLELIKVLNKEGSNSVNGNIDMIGMHHLSFGIDDIDIVVRRIEKYGGEICTNIYQIGKNNCCFAKDPEGNWIELIAKRR